MILNTIDLFSGIGGIRLGFERACESAGIEHACVFASDINKNACKVYRSRFGDQPDPLCDITKVDPSSLPDFDVLLGGFPCQAFSTGGHGGGFNDTRGTLFFNVADILKVKQPKAVLLENVKGLTHHDEGRTLGTIRRALNDAGYTEHVQILNSKDFGVPQNRPRVYIVGFLKDRYGGLFDFPKPTCSSKRLFDILQPNPVDENHYLSKSYWDTLLRHRARHESKGQGFGYVIKKGGDVASTVMCGGMGKERNLIVDDSSRPLPDWANAERVRTMTPVEWERLQGFPDGWTEAAPTSSRMSLLGNSVTVSVIEAVSKKIVAELVNPSNTLSSIFG